MALEGYIFGMFFGAVCRDQATTSHLLPIVLLPIMIFGGLVVNVNNIPVYIRWLQYLSPMRHSFLILFQSQMASNKFKDFAIFNLP
jgi:ABC-type multidrug transport system permease subunit